MAWKHYPKPEVGERVHAKGVSAKRGVVTDILDRDPVEVTWDDGTVEICHLYYLKSIDSKEQAAVRAAARWS